MVMICPRISAALKIILFSNVLLKQQQNAKQSPLFTDFFFLINKFQFEMFHSEKDHNNNADNSWVLLYT